MACALFVCVILDIAWAENKILLVCPLPGAYNSSHSSVKNYTLLPLPIYPTQKIYIAVSEKYLYFSMAEMYDLGFIKSFKCWYTNLLNLPFLDNLCIVCEISICLILTCLYYMYK